MLVITKTIRKKLILASIILFCVGFFAYVLLSDFSTESSAQMQITGLTKVELTEDEYIKKLAMRKVLEKYNSPLTGREDDFILVARVLDLDYYLLPSITGVESFFARRMINGTFNPFGFGKGTIQFDNWGDGIARVGYSLRYKYINRGADTLPKIGVRYAGGSTTWAPKVQHFMNQFQKEEAKIRSVYNLL